MLGYLFADTSELGEIVAVRQHLVHGDRVSFDGASGVLIGADAKRIGALDFE